MSQTLLQSNPSTYLLYHTNLPGLFSTTKLTPFLSLSLSPASNQSYIHTPSPSTSSLSSVVSNQPTNHQRKKTTNARRSTSRSHHKLTLQSPPSTSQHRTGPSPPHPLRHHRPRLTDPAVFSASYGPSSFWRSTWWPSCIYALTGSPAHAACLLDSSCRGGGRNWSGCFLGLVWGFLWIGMDGFICSRDDGWIVSEWIG